MGETRGTLFFITGETRETFFFIGETRGRFFFITALSAVWVVHYNSKGASLVGFVGAVFGRGGPIPVPG
jgi:hypothetical protein